MLEIILSFLNALLGVTVPLGRLPMQAPMQAPVLLLAAVTVLSLALVMLPLLGPPRAGASNRQQVHRFLVSYRLSYTLMLVLCSVLMLSACGTAPPQAATCPPVPAALLDSPQAPVLLQPNTRLKTPGPTTQPTPPVAEPTGQSISV